MKTLKELVRCVIMVCVGKLLMYCELLNILGYGLIVMGHYYMGKMVVRLVGDFDLDSRLSLESVALTAKGFVKLGCAKIRKIIDAAQNAAKASKQ